MPCTHTKGFAASVAVNVLEDNPGKLMADVRVWCSECKMPMRFIGLPGGASTSRPMCSVFGEEARMPLEPLDIDGWASMNPITLQRIKEENDKLTPKP